MSRNDNTGKVFRRKEPETRALTSTRIAADLDAFRKAGGEIEVLGVTRVLTKLEAADVPDAAKAAPMRAAPGGRRRGPG
jgi:hypothetical protein